MNIDYLGKCSTRQHKATLAVAQQLVCVPAPLITSLPIIARKGTNLIYMSVEEGPKPDMDFVNPYVMNGSFSLELRLKYLHALETGNKLPQTHELRTLFDNLTPESRESTARYLNERAHQDPICKRISKMLQSQQVQFQWNLPFILAKNNLAFERWRYIYDKKGDIAWFCGYTQVMAALDHRISQLPPQASGAA